MQLDDQLLRALHEGSNALPVDLDRLHGYLRLIGVLLAEKAQEHEPAWRQVLASAAEIETLQDLEALVVEKAIAVRARTLWAVISKLAIWASLDDGAADGPEVTQRDRLVDSARRDIERIARNGDSRLARMGGR